MPEIVHWLGGWALLLRLEWALPVALVAWLVKRIESPGSRRRVAIVAPCLLGLTFGPLLSGLFFIEGGATLLDQLGAFKFPTSQDLTLYRQRYPFHAVLAILLLLQTIEIGTAKIILWRPLSIAMAVLAHVASAIWVMLISA